MTLIRTKKGGIRRKRSKSAPSCKGGRPACGGRCLPQGHICRKREEQSSKLAKQTNKLENLIKQTKLKTNKANPLKPQKVLTAINNLQKDKAKAGKKRTRDLSKTQKSFIGGSTLKSQGGSKSGLPDEPAGSPKLDKKLQNIVKRITGAISTSKTKRKQR